MLLWILKIEVEAQVLSLQIPCTEQKMLAFCLIGDGQ